MTMDVKKTCAKLDEMARSLSVMAREVDRLKIALESSDTQQRRMFVPGRRKWKAEERSLIVRLARAKLPLEAIMDEMVALDRHWKGRSAAVKAQLHVLLGPDEYAAWGRATKSEAA